MIAVATVVFFRAKKNASIKKQQKETQESQTKVSNQQLQPLQIEKQEVKASDLPELLPKDLPKEDGVEVLQNFYSTTPSGDLIASREYRSKRSFEQNVALFANFLKTSSWRTLSTLQAGDRVVFSATKASDVLQVAIVETRPSNLVTVSLDITRTKLAPK